MGDQDGLRVSTLDLAGHGQFALVTGIGGEDWLDAAAELAGEAGVAITPVSIGPGEPYEDPYGTWADLREIQDGGALLVRPDLYIAARHIGAPSSRHRPATGSPTRWKRYWAGRPSHNEGGATIPEAEHPQKVPG